MSCRPSSLVSVNVFPTQPKYHIKKDRLPSSERLSLRRRGTILGADLAAVVPRQAGPRSGAEDPLRDRRRHLPLGAVAGVLELLAQVHVGRIHPPAEVVKAPLPAERAGHGGEAAAPHPVQRSDALPIGYDQAGVGGRGDDGAGADGRWRCWRIGPEQRVDVRFAGRRLHGEAGALRTRTARGGAVAAAPPARPRRLQIQRGAGAGAPARGGAGRDRLEETAGRGRGRLQDRLPVLRVDRRRVPGVEAVFGARHFPIGIGIHRGWAA